MTRAAVCDGPRTYTCPLVPCSRRVPCVSCHSWPTWVVVAQSLTTVCEALPPGSCGRCSVRPWNDYFRSPSSPHTIPPKCPVHAISPHKISKSCCLSIAPFKSSVFMKLCCYYFPSCLNVFISGLSCNFRAVVSVITNSLSVLRAHFFTCSYSCFVL